ncbi:MAG: LytR/AlgR family response regulator transcription factor [Saprospiraceae bacterium]
MITAIIVDDEAKARAVLEEKIRQFCPQLHLIGQAEDAEAAYRLITEKRPALVFLDVAMPRESGFDLLKRLPNLDFEIIFATAFDEYALDAIKFCAVGYLLKPIQTEELVQAVHLAQGRIEQKLENIRNRQLLNNLLHPGNANNRIGIPTMDGLEFVPTSQIIRCEGLQKCTRVVIQETKDIVSSYNLGEFRKLLEEYGFFAVHKSYLINMSHIRRFDREGTVTMVDGSHVPVSKRKKQEFLDQLTRI